MTTRCLPDVPTLRRLAVLGSVDPRTLVRVLSGQDVRGMAGERAKRVLLAEGYIAPSSAQASSQNP